MTIAELSHEEKDQRLVAGRYRLHARIGHGRLGDIYQADDEGYRELGVGQHVAIQLLPQTVALAPGLFDKLQSGYTVLRSVSHPNIVTFSDVGHDGKFGYVVMDLLEGASLRFILDDAATLLLDEAIPIIRAVGDALQFLHSKSMVHGKLTANNVFVTENLEVRLLDVVPMDAALDIPRGGASNDPFSRHDVGGDVYGLACLTYEILAGKHPFNFRAPAEARLARLEPARIDSLSERQWNAIRRGLSFDHEQRILSVADFLREFGIDGTERLRPSDDMTTNLGLSSRSPENNAPPATHSATSPRSSAASAHVAPAIPRVPVPRHDEKLEIAPAKRKSVMRIPSLVLVMALIGLSVWSLYGHPRDDVVILVNYVNSYLDGKSAGNGNTSLPNSASNPNPAASQDEGSATLLSATATRSAADNGTGPGTAGGSLGTGDAVGSAVTSTRPAYPTVEIASPDNQVYAGASDEAGTLPADEQLADSGTDALRSNLGSAADALASTPDITVPSRSLSEFTLTQSVVSISERDGAARVTARHIGDMAGRVFWWTSDHSAVANQDYISIEQPVVGFASGEETETLYIPLVNDNLPEQPETFYVYLGRHDAQLGRLEPILSVRVDISDDDY
jgi:serine/threonine protein kinase